MNPWEQLRRLGARGVETESLPWRQWSWLGSCLARNAKCAYGQRYGFADIDSVEAFRGRVPLVGFDDVADLVAEMAVGTPDVLFSGHAVAFERTSGSSGGSKLIPYSADSLADFRRAVLPWLSTAMDGYQLDSGCAYWAISPATRPEERTAGGIPIGLPDGAYLGEEALPAFAALSAVPPEIGAVPDVDAWRLLTLYWLLRQDDLALVSVWSPTFFISLLDALDTHDGALYALLSRGGVVGTWVLEPDADAAGRLRAYRRERDTRHLWPQLKLISCWGDASSAAYLEALGARLPQARFQPKGLLSTEGVVSGPGSSGVSVLAAGCGFFEFIADGGRACFAHELAVGARYEVVMTTSGGLYRYRTGDLVCCLGHEGELPRLKFLGRGSLSSDLVGEKLVDNFVADCLADIPGFRMLVPDVDKPGYVLSLDAALGDAPAWAGNAERALQANPYYAYARRMGQLAPLRGLQVRAPLERYVRRAVAQGARLGDVKPPNLRPETGWLHYFMDGMS